MKHRLRDKHLQSTDKKQFLQDDPYKISIHSSNNFNKSDSGSKRLNLSRMLENSRKKISMRKASEMFQSGVRPQSSKNAKRNQVVEFDNMKWISIISAYDPSRLKNVSVSKKTCQRFFQTQGQNIKTDSRSTLYFNDLIKNFKSWLNKIHIQYFYIMETFLYGKRSVNTTLSELRPKIDQVINETSHMQENLENCLTSYENHEFRQLLKKYQAYLQNSKEIEDIIVVVNKSKTKIVDLYKKFDDDKKIEQKLNRVKNDGIHEVKKIICEHNEVQIENQIMQRIQLAINEMAQKSGEAYRKIRGIKQLISKFKNTETQSGQVMQKLDLESINLMGKVCKEICFEADAFDAFSSRFLNEGDIINDDLKNIIKKYEEDMMVERKRAIELQMKFLNIILSETIKRLKQNSKIAVVYENAEAHHEEYRKVLRMIQDVADCLIDQNKKIALEKLIKETKTVFDRLYEELRYLKQNKKFEQIDTEEGLISILEVSKLIKEYKDKILLVRKKFELTHRDIIMTPVKIQQISHDRETDFINSVIALSKKINNSNLKDRIQHVACFGSVSNGFGLVKMSEQVTEENILEDITIISNQFLELQEQNILEQYFGPLRLENLIFKESIVMIEIKKLSSKTKEKNLIPQLSELLKKRNQWIEKHKRTSPQMKRFFERILADSLVKGLKEEDIKQIENPRSIPFPTKDSQIQTLKSKAKYRQLLLDQIQNTVAQSTKSIQSQASQKDENYNSNKKGKTSKSKFNFCVSDILDQNITCINNFINSYIKVSQIKKNINSDYFLTKEYLIEFSERLFSMVYFQPSQGKNNQNESKQKISTWIQSLNKICSDRILFLTRAILEQENDWTASEKKRNDGNSVHMTRLPVHVEKVIELLEFYKSKTLQLSESCTKAVKVFNEPIENMKNSAEVLEDYSKLSLYGKVLVSLVKYLKDTEQIVHVVLDNSKCPIALLNPTKNSLKNIFPGLKKGKQLTASEIQKLVLNAANIGIELKAKKPKDSEPKQNASKSKTSKKQSEIMDEEIVEAEESMKQEMADEIPDDNVEEIQEYEDDMPDQMIGDEMGQEVNQEPEEEMIEDFEAPEDEIGDDIEEEKLEEMLEESQTLGKSKNKPRSKNQIVDDFEEYDWEENDDNKKKKKQAEEELKAKQLKAKQEEEKKRKEEDALKKKQEEERKAKEKEEQEKQKRLKKEHIKFSQTEPPKKIIQHSIYQVLGFITSLYQLKTLIGYVSSFEESYMKNNIQWSKVQEYFNNHKETASANETKETLEKAKKDVEKYIKSLDDEVDAKIKKDFQSEPIVFNEIKGLETIKQLKKDLLLLKNGNWETLQKILLLNHISYNILKTSSSVLYISIKDRNSEYDELASISGYLSKNFKYYIRAQFDLKTYTQKCFTTHQTGANLHRIVSYVAKNQRSLITNPSQTQKTYEKLKVVLDNFAHGAKDHVNKFELCLDLYKKALQMKEKVDLDLNWYADQIKFLQKSGSDQNDMLTHMNFVKENVKNVIKKIKSLESKLYNLSFKCEKNSIFECIQEMSELYGDEIEVKKSFKKGERTLTCLVFDKTNYKDNLNKIKTILSSSQSSSKESQAQKLIIGLLISSGDLSKQIKILQNAKQLKTKEYELLLEVISILRVDHSYILIKEKGLQFFSLREKKQECISNFIKKISGLVLQNKQISGLMSSNSCLTPFQSLLTSTDNSLYQNIFLQSKLKLLFKENFTENPHLKQVQVSVNQQYFNFSNQNWKQQSEKLIKNVIECVRNQKQEVSKVLINLKKLKPSRFIYEKHLQAQKPQQIPQLWKGHQQSFKKIQTSANELISTNHWVLAVNSIISELKDEVVQPVSEHLDVISSLLSTESKSHSLQDIQSEVTNVFNWLQGLCEQDSKHKFLVVTLPGDQPIAYFDSDVESFNQEYFSENFGFLIPKNSQLDEFLYGLVFANVDSQKNEEMKKQLQLQAKDTIYHIDSEKLSVAISAKISEVSSPTHHQKRHKIIREFVRLFNKIYFVTKTSNQINFKQESQALINLQNEIKKEFIQLQVIYQFKNFISKYGAILWKGHPDLLKLNKILQNQFVKNEKIPDDEISNILEKLGNIKVNKSYNTIDSYDPFFAWVYHTVISLLKLPFYNIITHSIINSESKAESQFLAVVVTEKQTDPRQENEELQKYLKEMFLVTDHKPIYLKENDLTVELTKEPAFVELSLTIKDIELKQIISFLNQNYKEEEKTEDEPQKEFYLRIDELREKTNLKGKTEVEQIFLQLIPLKEFLKSSEQEFNLQIDQVKLCSSIECNIVFAPSEVTKKTDLKKCLPLNGTAVDSFNEVYMGKVLKLEKLKDWLYKFYKGQKNEIESKNKQFELESFCSEFIVYHKQNVLEENKPALEKVFKNISTESVKKSRQPSKEEVLYLSSSELLKKQCTKNLAIFKEKKYSEKPEIEKLYGEDLKELMIRIQENVYKELYNLEKEIKVNMEKKLKKQAAEKIKEIEKNYSEAEKKRKQDEEAEKAKKSAAKSTKQIPTPQGQNPNQQPAQSLQKQSVPQIPAQSKEQRQRKMLQQLKSTDFKEYLQKKIEFVFKTFSKADEKELKDQIIENFKEKIKECKHFKADSLKEELSKRVDASYEGKLEKEKVIFLFLLLEKNDITYSELYVSSSQNI